MQRNSDNLSMQEAIQLAKSPAGQQLLSILRHSDGMRLQEAADLVAEGKYTQAQQMLSDLLSNPDVQSLLAQLGR